MAGYPSLALVKAAELLADGKWHDYAEIVRKVAAVVPPGQALRKAEQIRVASARRGRNYRNPEVRKIPRSDQRLIEYGATAIVRQALSGSVMFEIEPRGTLLRDGPKRVRLVKGKQIWRPPDD